MKTKLNKRTRNELIAFARTKIKFPELLVKIDRLYKKAEAEALDAVYDNYPPDIMAHLNTYGVAKRMAWMAFAETPDKVPSVKFEFKGERPLIPINRNPTGYAENMQFLREHKDAVDFYNKAIERQVDAYKKLVWSAVFFEDIIPIWPEAAELMPKGTALVASIDQDAAHAVAQDYAARVGARMNVDRTSAEIVDSLWVDDTYKPPVFK